MKKILILISILLLTSCSSRQDYFTLGINDYKLTPGYDNVEYLKVAYNFDIPSTIEPNQSISLDMTVLDSYLAYANIVNPKDKIIDSNEAILKDITIYLKDLGGRKFYLNDEPLASSIKTNCDKYNGQYIERNGYACVIEKQVNNKNNYIIMYGDYLNIDQDELDHIVIGVK